MFECRREFVVVPDAGSHRRNAIRLATTGRTGSLPYSLRPVAVGLLAVVFFPDVLQIFGVHGLSRSVGGFLQLLASFACAWAVIALLEPFNTRDVVRNVAQHGEAAP